MNLTFNAHSAVGTRIVSIEINTLVIAGWAGRDEAAVRHHIEELQAIGVPPPSSVPVFYRCSASTLTQATVIDVLGPDSSGEVEPVIVALEDGLWLGIGSDHTDRKAETFGIALSKQLCPKMIGPDLWRLDEIEARWDSLAMRSFAEIDGEWLPYQAGTLAGLRPPADLIARWTGGGGLSPGTVMFGGTFSAIGGIRPALSFEMELVDAATGRALRHAYRIESLPIVV